MSETGAMIGEPTGRPFYSRLVIGGLITIVVMMVMLGIVQLASSDTSNLAFLIINIAIALIVAGLIWRFGSWALVLGAIAGLLGTGLSYGPYLITSTGSINSVFDFGVAVVTTVASIMALVGSIVAFVQLRRGTGRVEATAVERNALRGVAAVVAVLVVVSAVATLTARDTVEQADRAGAIEVLMKTTEFRTAQLTPKLGRRSASSSGTMTYTYTPSLSTSLASTQRSDRVEKRRYRYLRAIRRIFEYKCTVPGHESMTGTLTVR